MDLRTAVADFDRASVAEAVARAEQQRQQILDLFPLDRWPTLPLTSYALGLGQGGNETGYSRLIEFVTTDLGSISGGSAGKHMMFRHNSGEWRLAPPLVGLEVDAAWERLRGQFVAAFDAAGRGAFAELDELDVLLSGQMVVTKSLATYFPQHFLPVFSVSHLRAFIETLGGTPERNAPAWRANRQLRELVVGTPEFAGWAPQEVMRFLYQEFNPKPRKRAAWKIAPGKNAVYWGDCLAGGYICVGWDEVGDLTQYASDTELKEALDSSRPDEGTGGNLVKARNLLAFRDLEPGDRIVANRGKSHVLAIGAVTGGYRRDESREHLQHVVPVQWDTSYQQDLPEPQNAWVPTFHKVPDALLTRLLRGPSQKVRELDENAIIELPEDISHVLAALDRKGQAILYGPPGTGKTRLAINTALAAHGRGDHIDSADRANAVETMLDSGRTRIVTFHPSYGYEDFVEGFKPAHHPTGAGLHLELTDGLFHKLCTAAAADKDETFLLIIDEINRGDLPRIFGELITLLESDKRGMSVDLPISQRKFTVPPNVRIIATMNTADRSVSHLDAAIRRRFAFLHVSPDPDTLSGAVGPLDLPGFLSSLNDRITASLDTDHQIGHAYLLRNNDPVATEEELAAAYYHDILPLIEDYCIGRVELLRQILGRLVDANTGRPAHIAISDLPNVLAEEFTAGAQDLDD